MKTIIKYFIFLYPLLFFSQKKVEEKVQLLSNDLEIHTNGLDHLELQNSNSKFVEVFLYAENYDEQLIKIQNLEKLATIKFEFKGTETREVIFRKFITKRLQRANVIVKIPKDKKVTIYGENVDIESKSCLNPLSIYIDNGIIKLSEIKKNTTVKLYAGNVYASIKKVNLDVKSNLGKIIIDSILQKDNYLKKSNKFLKNLTIETVKGNIFLKMNKN